MYNPTLQKMLEDFQTIAGEEPHVYYQPPENVKLVYPCFVYVFDNTETIYAGGRPYLHFDRYSVTYITKKSTSRIVNAMRTLPHMDYDTHFTSENLHHYVFLTCTNYYMEPNDDEFLEAAHGFLGGSHGKN